MVDGHKFQFVISELWATNLNSATKHPEAICFRALAFPPSHNNIVRIMCSYYQGLLKQRQLVITFYAHKVWIIV